MLQTIELDSGMLECPGSDQLVDTQGILTTDISVVESFETTGKV
jgi:hypothetical protein